MVTKFVPTHQWMTLEGWGVIHVEIVRSDFCVVCHCQVVFIEVLCNIFFSQMPMNSEILLYNLIYYPKDHISMYLKYCFLIVSFAIPAAEELML